MTPPSEIMVRWRVSILRSSPPCSSFCWACAVGSAAVPVAGCGCRSFVRVGSPAICACACCSACDCAMLASGFLRVWLGAACVLAGRTIAILYGRLTAMREHRRIDRERRNARNSDGPQPGRHAGRRSRYSRYARNAQSAAMASISTSAPFGMSLPPKATRAGLTEPMKVCAYTSSTSWKSSTFFM